MVGFGAVFGLSAVNGGFFPTSWGWAALSLLLLAAAALIARDDVPLSRPALALLALLGGLVAWTAFSALWAPAAATPLLETERACVYLGAVAVLFLVPHRLATRAIAAGVAWAAVGISVWALSGRLFPGSAPGSAGLGAYRLTGPIGYWNGLGLLVVLGLFLSLGFTAEGASRAGRAAGAAALVVLLPTLEFTFSRGSWLALAIGLVALAAFQTDRLRLLPRYALALPAPLVALALASNSDGLTKPGSTLGRAAHDGHRLALAIVLLAAVAAGLAIVADRVPAPRVGRRRARSLGAAGAAVLVLLVVVAVAHEGGPSAVWSRVTDSFRSEATDPAGGNLNGRLLSTSANGRTDYWRVAWREVEAHPLLGGGAGSFDRWWLRRRPTAYGALDAHNLYLETLAELGPIGLALVLAVLAVPFATLLAVRRKPLVAACCAAYVAFLTHAALDWDWELTGVGLAGLLCGAAVVAAADPAPATTRRPFRVAGAAVAIVLAAFVFVLHVGNVSLAASSAALDRDDTATAVRDARRARSWLPWSAKPLVALGEAQLSAGDVGAAAATFRRAVRQDAGDWEAWYDLGLSTQGSERRNALRVAAVLNPRAPELAALAH